MKKTYLLGAALAFTAMTGCQPQTPTEKAKDSIEDAKHEAGQGIERAGDKIKDATN